MHLLWKRYSRSGTAPAWFYAAIAGAFAGLIVWGIVASNWLVAALAAAMVLVTLAGAKLLRRAGESLEASNRARAAQEEEHER